MIFDKTFIRLATIVTLLIAGIGFNACHRDDPNHYPPQDEPQSEIKPGDNFYRYANAEWFKSLEGSNPQTHYGWSDDISTVNDKALATIKESMPQYKVLNENLRNLESNYDASIELLNEILASLTDDIKTKEDAYVAYGKAIRLGIKSIGTIHVGVVYEDNSIGYFFTPAFNQDANEETAARPLGNFTRPQPMTKYHRYMATTRSENSAVDYILEGIGLDPQHYLVKEDYTQAIATLEQMTLQQLTDALKTAVESELRMYCSDEYAATYSQQQYGSVAQLIEESIEDDLGYYTSYYFCDKYISTETKDRFRTLANNLIGSFHKRLENNAWLSETTKQAAIEKLEHMGMDFGSPDKWPITTMLELDSDILLENVLAIKAGRYDVIASLMGADISDYRPIYFMYSDPEIIIYPYIPNAYYDGLVNAFFVFAPLMMDPAYSSDIKDIELYSSLGTIIAHEITHGFDRDGAEFDKNGERNNWWNANDAALFKELNDSMIEHVSTFEVIPGVYANGANTVLEDVADLGGFNIAYDYWVDTLQERGITGNELAEQKRLFFMNYAKIYRAKYPDSYMILLVQNDEHSVGHIRVNGIVQHIDDWYELFDVQEGDALYLAPEKRITIW